MHLFKRVVLDEDDDAKHTQNHEDAGMGIKRYFEVLIHMLCIY